MCVFVLYFIYVMHFSVSESANTFTNYMGSSFLLSLVGGFISDTYLSRLTTCLTFGLLQLAALAMITFQAYSTNLQPEACDKSICLKGGKALYFYSYICLLALGAGGVRGALPALGADQFERNDPKGAKGLATYFNWYVLSTTLGAIFGVTGVVWIAMNKGYYWGFFVGTLTSSVGYVFLALGKPFYLVRPRGGSPLARVAQVIVVAIRNRNLSLPQNSDQLYEMSEKERDPSEEKVSHTNQFRSLDKAAILQEGTNPNPWRVCKDPNKNAAHISKHIHNEHMLVPAINLLRRPGLHDGPTLGPPKHPLRVSPSNPLSLHVCPHPCLRMPSRALCQEVHQPPIWHHAAPTRGGRARPLGHIDDHSWDC
ncbi:hypothetical protein Acr_28g0013080 [Actinidia rufa]|uniref:Major facilitator superfamily protein n=1 Tax=Actinidia rufa TaxID=165716 RepID=A0A7J0HBY3_9ERIC|nr:hypothetical protein Acr_28g0013080 [Actinidia rufa]